MANPTADYPTALHTSSDVSGFGSSKLGSTTPTHTALEGKQESEVVAVQTKIGTGSSTPAANKVLRATGTGTSGWGAVVDADIDPTADAMITAIEFVIDGGGSAITTGEKGHLEIPFNCTINRVTLVADAAGAIVVDIWKDTYANFPPTDADTITASAPPTIAATNQKAQDATLTGWTTTIAAGDILAFNVDSCATITRVTVSLKVTKT